MNQKCRCRLEIFPVEIDPGCYWHAPRNALPHVTTYAELSRQLTAQETDADVIHLVPKEVAATFAAEAKKTLEALAFNATAYVRQRVPVEYGAHIGRWRCPVCKRWVDQNAGWHIIAEEEICGECYRIFKGGEPKQLGPDQWIPR